MQSLLSRTFKFSLVLERCARQRREVIRSHFHVVIPVTAQQRCIVRGIADAKVFFRDYGARSFIKTEGKTGEVVFHARYVVIGQKEIAKARTRCEGYDGCDRAGWTGQPKISTRALVQDVNDEGCNSDANE